jgi:transposase
MVDRRQHRPRPSLCRWGRKKRDAKEPADHALGRSRGGFSTKIHILCDGEGRPLNIELSPGQSHETQSFEDLWNSTEVLHPQRNYLIQPDALAGDKAYRSALIVKQLQAEGVEPVIPEIGIKANDEQHPDFDREKYRRRNVVERLIGWLKESRRVFGRFEKTAVNYLAMIHAACTRFYLAELLD